MFQSDQDRLQLIQNIQAMGAYVFKSTTLHDLKEQCQDFYESLDLDKRVVSSTSYAMNAPLYVIGFAARMFDTPSGTEIYRPLDAQDTIANAVFRGTVSILKIYADPTYSCQPETRKFPGIEPIRILMRTAGVQTSISRYSTLEYVQDQLEACTRCFQLEHKPTASAHLEKSQVPISRETALDALKKWHECLKCRIQGRCPGACEQCSYFVDMQVLDATLDSTIKVYASVLEQNKSGKYVRMADGSRKWMRMEEAEKLLSVPRSKRK